MEINKIFMKSIIIALLIALALAGGSQPLPDALPSCFVGLPFSFPLGSGWSFSTTNLPSFAILDSAKGVITGVSHSAGAYSFGIKASNGATVVEKQLIINVIDTKDSTVWASQTDNYYSRNVTNPFKVVPSSTDKTVVQVGDKFSYTFSTQNNVGKPVFAFSNLPAGLTGNTQTGTISGALTIPGIYTFGVESADQAGNTAEGFVTVTCGNGGLASLNKVTVNNQVPFVFDINQVQQEQVQADKQLFAALAAVNEAKAQVAARQGVFDGINAKLAAAEAAADQAAATASNANTNRQVAANRLTITNKALNDAEDKLNLALLYQAGAQANVKKAEGNLVDAQNKFNAAQKLLANAEAGLQAAQATLNAKKLAETEANTALQNAQKDYDRANQDLNDAKNAVSRAQDALNQAQSDLTKAKNDLSLASQAWEQAQHQLKEATIQLASAEAARQAALKVLQDATAANQHAISELGAAEWNLNQAIAALNVANAAKDAADRTSALVIANGVPQTTPKVDITASFTSCNNTNLPRYSGSVKVSQVYGDRALLVTGNTVIWGACTQGSKSIAAGVTVTIVGAINPTSKCIEVYSAQPAKVQ